MTGVLHVLWLQLSPPLPSSLGSIKPCSPGKMAIKTDRDYYYLIRQLEAYSKIIQKETQITGENVTSLAEIKIKTPI